MTVSATEEETEPESKYSTADAEKFYLDLLKNHNGIGFYYIAATTETNIHNMRLDLTGVDYVSTYVADGNDYSDVILDGVSVFDTLTDEEYDVFYLMVPIAVIITSSSRLMILMHFLIQSGSPVGLLQRTL